MPGSTTHSYILYRALRAIEAGPSSPLFSAIVASHNLAVAHARRNDAKSLGKDAGAALAGCAYLGSCGPDLFYLENGAEAAFIADLLHYNRSGPFVIWWLRNLRAEFTTMMHPTLGLNLFRQFAYCLGHISHIAADITAHPYVNSIVGAYPENLPVFKNARGMLPTKMWKFHNILEHYQDSYVLYRRFQGEERFGKDTDCVNLALPAAKLIHEGKLDPLGLVEATRQFYRYGIDLSKIEPYKYACFANKNPTVRGGYYSWVNIDGYYSDVIPNDAMMTRVPRLVQGGTFAKDGRLASPGLFDRYLDEAVDLTVRMWREAAGFLSAEKEPDPQFPGHRLSPAELKAFPLLGRH